MEILSSNEESSIVVDEESWKWLNLIPFFSPMRRLGLLLCQVMLPANQYQGRQRYRLVASSTQSISSSIVEYRKENGRTYRAYKDGSK